MSSSLLELLINHFSSFHRAELLMFLSLMFIYLFCRRNGRFEEGDERMVFK